MFLAHARHAPMLKVFSLEVAGGAMFSVGRAINCRWSETESDQIAQPAVRKKKCSRSRARAISTDNRRDGDDTTWAGVSQSGAMEEIT